MGNAVAHQNSYKAWNFSGRFFQGLERGGLSFSNGWEKWGLGFPMVGRFHRRGAEVAEKKLLLGVLSVSAVKFYSVAL
ncbi:MAG: hypothetical protein WCK89_24105, partial [bacterium]